MMLPRTVEHAGKPLARQVRHHCHVSGVFLYAACNNCNLQLKVTSRIRKGQHDDDDDEKKKKKQQQQNRE